MTWTPDRRPIRAIRCWAGNYCANDLNLHLYTDFGLTPFWRNGGVPWILQELECMRRAGYERFLIFLPAGMKRRRRIPGQPNLRFPSAQYQVLDRDSRGQKTGIYSKSGSVAYDFADLITPWLEANPEIEICFYTGFRIKSAFDREIPYDETTEGENAIPNLSLSEHREIIHANTQGFLDLTPDSSSPQVHLGFDKSATSQDRDCFIELMKDFRSRSIKVIGEAIPTDSESGLPLECYYTQCPWLVLSKAHFQRDTGNLPNYKATWNFDPKTSEVGIGLNKDSILEYLEIGDERLYVPRERYGAACGVLPNDELTDEHKLCLFKALINDFHCRGCVFYSFAPAEQVLDWERYILEITKCFKKNKNLHFKKFKKFENCEKANVSLINR